MFPNRWILLSRTFVVRKLHETLPKVVDGNPVYFGGDAISRRCSLPKREVMKMDDVKKKKNNNVLELVTVGDGQATELPKTENNPYLLVVQMRT